jgi:outer membrane protein assembly factor BamB
VAWKTALPGPGHSSPVVWRDRIFLTAFKSNEGTLGRMTSALTSKLAMGHRPTGQLFVLCLDRTSGRVVWEREVAAPAIEEVHYTNSPATPTPVTDGSLVYVYFGSRGLFAYDFNGKLVWEKPLGPFANEWGSGSSPVLYDDLLLLNIDSDGEDFLLAVDRRSGKTVWQAPRTNAQRAWPTPAVWRKPDGDEIVVSGSARVIGYDAKTGTERWRVNGLASGVPPTPFVAHGLLYVASGGSGGNAVLAIGPGGRGDVTTTHVAWRTERVAPYISSPVIGGDLLFTVRDGGIVACLDAMSGRLIWQQRIAADGKIYVTNEDGVVTVLAAKPSFRCCRPTTSASERSRAPRCRIERSSCGATSTSGRSDEASAPQLERQHVLSIPHVEPRADERRHGPRRLGQDVRARQDLDALGRDRREAERPILVQDDELVVGIHERRPREAAIAPGLLPVLHVDRGDERRPEVATGAVSVVANSNHGADVHAHPVGEEQLLDVRLRPCF